MNIKQIIVLGGLGGRFDHIFGVLNSVLLHKLELSKQSIFLIDGENVVTVLFEVLSAHKKW